MALTNITTAKGTKAPSAPLFPVRVEADLDNSYPAGGYPLNELGATDDPGRVFPGAKIVMSEPRTIWDGAAVLRWARLVDVAGVATLKVYADDNGAPGAEVAGTTDLSLHTGVELEALAQ